MCRIIFMVMTPNLTTGINEVFRFNLGSSMKSYYHLSGKGNFINYLFYLVIRLLLQVVYVLISLSITKLLMTGPILDRLHLNHELFYINNTQSHFTYRLETIHELIVFTVSVII